MFADALLGRSSGANNLHVLNAEDCSLVNIFRQFILNTCFILGDSTIAELYFV